MNLHEDYQPRTPEKQATDRSFGFVFTAFFAIWALLPLWRGRPLRLWALPVSAAFLVVTLVRPSLLHAANRLWTRLGLLLGKVVSPLITGLLFYGVVTPMGLLARLVGKDLLHLRWSPQQPSYWIDRRPPGPDPKTMNHQF